jgi:DNA primase
LAAHIPEETIDSIKTASDIVDIVSEVVSLRQAGRNYLGLCPFHAEKTPSFTVSPDKQIFYCFGCGAGGDIFSFLMKHAGLTFPEAARELAGRSGIDLPTRDLSPREKKKLTDRETMLSLNGEAMGFYRDCLLDAETGQQAMGYLLNRGMTRQTLDTFRVGFAPDSWDGLLRRFRSRRRPEALALAAGLIVARQKGPGHYDRFRNRVIFPIFNAQHQPVAFGGRVMDDALPKYLNSPETPVYSKSRSLYGLDRARPKCRETQTVHVVEGYFDLLAMHQFGISNTVATLGTALTADHVRLLSGCVGHGGKAILVFDSDRAGIKAAQRSVAVFQKGLLEARILVLPEGHDPDSFLMAHGADDFLAAVARSVALFAFMVSCAIEQHGLDIDGKVRIVNDLSAAIMAVDDPVSRSLHIHQLAERIGVDEKAILQKIRRTAAPQSKLRGRPDRPTIDPKPDSDPVRGEAYRLERQLVAMMLQFPEMIAEIARRRLLAHFTDPVLADVARAIVERGSTAAGDVASLISDWADARKKAVVARLAITDERWDQAGCIHLIEQFERLVQRRDTALLRRIAEAEKRGDVTLVAALLQEKQQQAQRANRR